MNIQSQILTACLEATKDYLFNVTLSFFLQLWNCHSLKENTYLIIKHLIIYLFCTCSEFEII